LQSLRYLVSSLGPVRELLRDHSFIGQILQKEEEVGELGAEPRGASALRRETDEKPTFPLFLVGRKAVREQRDLAFSVRIKIYLRPCSTSGRGTQRTAGNPQQEEKDREKRRKIVISTLKIAPNRKTTAFLTVRIRIRRKKSRT